MAAALGQHGEITGAGREGVLSDMLEQEQKGDMSLSRIHRAVRLGLAALLVLALCGCANQSEQDRQARDEKTRDEVAKATERAKPTLEKAGKKLSEVAKAAAEQAQAAAEGVRQGWERENESLLDLNSASETELLKLPGITHRDARRIMDGRPYRDEHELVTRHILSNAGFEKIRGQVIVK